MSDFAALNTALSALYAQRRGMEMAGHNVANVNTEGYTRQRVQLESAAGVAIPGIHAKTLMGTGGVRVADLQRLQDAFLEARGLSEHALDAGLRGSASLLTRIEGIFAEPGENGVASLLSEFWSSWDDVGNQPQDTAARAQLLERAQTLVSALNQADANLSSLRTRTIDEMKAQVAEVNAAALEIAELNQSIARSTLAGLSPNDLLDKRDLLIGNLAEQVGVTVRDGDNGVRNVFLGGTALVLGSDAQSLYVDDMGSPVVLKWTTDGYAATVSNGEMSARLAGVNAVIPADRAALDNLAALLVTTVNTQHALGYALDGTTTGVAFFDPAYTTAASVRVDGTLAGNPSLIAAASAASSPMSGGNAHALAELANLAGGPDESYRTFIVGMGVTVQTTNRRVEVQGDIVAQVDNARLSESGVNLDEEMTNMLAYQRAYEAASRFMRAVDEMIGVLLGIV